MITEIKIKDIKGLSDRTFNYNIVPNKPNLFVAPNGFGKSSIAVAFDSLKRTGIRLEEDNRYRQTDGNPQISIKINNDMEFMADNESNSISDEFSIFVINSQLYPKASTRNIGGYTSTSSSICVKPITLVNTIPEKKEIDYSYTTMRQNFNDCGKLLINFTPLLQDEMVILEINKIRSQLKKMLQIRKGRKVKAFIDYINTFTGTKRQLETIIDDFSIINEINETQDIIECLSIILPDCNETPAKYINVIQLISLYENNKESFTSIVKYYTYIYERKKIDGILGSFDTTWKNITTKVSKGSLILELPSANDISNGERDILCFFAKLFEARQKFTKNKCILIIDEIFDYLDDGNLIAAQYFINEFINDFKENDKDLYPIILTHLDPNYFKTYCFNPKHVHYLDNTSIIVNRYNINNLLKNRKNLNDNIPKYFLHFHTDSVSEEESLKQFNVGSELYNAAQFRDTAVSELEKYKQDLNYDISLVCCGLRLKIEEDIYNKLPQGFKDQFLETRNTNNKLDFALEMGVDVPDIYYLLGIIYNEALHLDPQCKKLIPVGVKLRHKVIRKMITDVIDGD